jgi:hypothetical protein
MASVRKPTVPCNYFLNQINSTMNTKLLDYYKMILNKVSFDAKLFFKEYQKAVRALQSHEVGDLNNWLKSNGLYVIVSNREKSRTLAM